MGRETLRAASQVPVTPGASPSGDGIVSERSQRSNDVTQGRGSGTGYCDVRVRHTDLIAEDVSILRERGRPRDLKEKVNLGSA